MGIVPAMRVAILAVDGMFDSGLSSVLDILATANALSGRLDLPEPPFGVTPVGAGSMIRTAHGLQLPTTPWRSLDERPDVLVMPALGLRPPAAIVDEVSGHPSLGTISALCAEGAAMAAACSGTFFLAEAGILDGITATTSWWLAPAFRARYPSVDLDESRALAIVANVTTAGAAFAHIDLALALVHRYSPALAELVGRYLVVGDRPSQVAIAMPSVLASGDPTMSAFERYVRENLARPLRIGDIARAIGASERTLQRATAATTGMSPVRFVQEVRLDQAAFLLRTTNRPAAAIAAAVGYQNVSTLRTLIRRRRGSTMAALRGDRAGWPVLEQQPESAHLGQETWRIVTGLY
jgi:transcriptional regulator GlxA family with amidase domain